MAVFRIEKTRDYTVMSNHHLRDKSLSLKAKGLLSLMLSLPEEWDYTTKGLARICKDGVDSICAGVRELEEHGYVIRQRVRNPNGQLGAIEYTILEQPRPPEPEKPERENPVLDNPEQAYPVLEEPEQGNPAQLNTNRSSKEKSKKDLSSTEGSNPVLSSPQTPRGSDRKGRDRMRERERYRWHGGGSMQIQCWRSPRCSRRRTPEASHPSCLDCRYKSMAAFSVDLIGCVFVTAISAPISPVSPPYRPDKQGPRRSSSWRSG